MSSNAQVEVESGFNPTWVPFYADSILRGFNPAWVIFCGFNRYWVQSFGMQS